MFIGEKITIKIDTIYFGILFVCIHRVTIFHSLLPCFSVIKAIRKASIFLLEAKNTFHNEELRVYVANKVLRQSTMCGVMIPCTISARGSQ